MHVTIDTDDTAALTTSWRIQATAVAKCSILSLSSTGVCRESTESWPLSSSKEESSFTFSVDEDSDILSQRSVAVVSFLSTKFNFCTRVRGSKMSDNPLIHCFSSSTVCYAVSSVLYSYKLEPGMLVIAL